jgi:DNA-directed RNA polymerase subunit RPC12/RpoP
MSTYHGITKAICLNCGKITQDDTALEILNDSDATCTACNMHAVAWHTQGEIIVTAQVDDEEPIRYTILEDKGE